MSFEGLAIKTHRLITPLQDLRDAVILIEGEKILSVLTTPGACTKLP